MNSLYTNAIGAPRLDPDLLKDRPATAAPEGPGFGEVLSNAIEEVNSLQVQAGAQAEKVMTGEVTDIHTAMIAVQKADVSFQMMMQVRNKLVSAYQEIMKMQV